MNIYKMILIGCIILVFGGCTSSSLNKQSEVNKQNTNSNVSKDVNYSRYYKEYNGYNYSTKSEPMINYKMVANDAVKQLFQNEDVPKKIIVTDFVDLTSLKNNLNIGYILSNSIKDSLINIAKANVIESEISNYFKLSANGLRLLTRDIKKVKSINYKVDNAIVGTYTYNENELIIFVKLINLKTGIIKGSYTQSMLIGKNTLLPLSYKSK